MKSNPIIYAVSDSIGETAESVVKATVSQFSEEKFDVTRIPYVKDKAQIDKIIEEAAQHKAVICHTIVSPELRDHIADKALAMDVQVVDVLGPMIKSVEKATGMLPKNQAGLIHSLDHEYFKRVEAVEFAVKYDDGKNPMGLLKADVVIIGVSRSRFYRKHNLVIALRKVKGHITCYTCGFGHVNVNACVNFYLQCIGICIPRKRRC